MSQYDPMRGAPLKSILADMESGDSERWVETSEKDSLSTLAARLRACAPGPRRGRALSRVEAELEFR